MPSRIRPISRSAPAFVPALPLRPAFSFSLGTAISRSQHLPTHPSRPSPRTTLPPPPPPPAGDDTASSPAVLGEPESSLLSACLAASPSRISAALSAGADVRATDGCGRSALHFCAGAGLDDFVRRLVSCGAEVDAKDMLGQTPLYMATRGRMVATVCLLLEMGADTNIACLGELPVERAERMRAMEQMMRGSWFLKERDDLKTIVSVLDEATEEEEVGEGGVGGVDVNADVVFGTPDSNGGYWDSYGDGDGGFDFSGFDFGGFDCGDHGGDGGGH